MRMLCSCVYLQAVQDMCMHKMADKLYGRLQKVRVWIGNHT